MKQKFLTAFPAVLRARILSAATTLLFGLAGCRTPTPPPPQDSQREAGFLTNVQATVVVTNPPPAVGPIVFTNVVIISNVTAAGKTPDGADGEKEWTPERAIDFTKKLLDAANEGTDLAKKLSELLPTGDGALAKAERISKLLKDLKELAPAAAVPGGGCGCEEMKRLTKELEQVRQTIKEKDSIQGIFMSQMEKDLQQQIYGQGLQLSNQIYWGTQGRTIHLPTWKDSVLFCLGLVLTALIFTGIEKWRNRPHTPPDKGQSPRLGAGA